MPIRRSRSAKHLAGLFVVQEETKSRAFSDKHIACFRGDSEWAFETGYILSPFDSGGLDF
jgi:hypothetical protein